jgi:Ca-activated chloride channel family protein
MPPHRHLVAIALLALALVTGGAARDAAAKPGDEPVRTVLVLDASGSMWGVVDGRPKIEIARDVIRDLMTDWDERVELGLVAYGHRSRRDCADIETLIEIGPPDAARVTAAAGALRPIGMTPIGDAVRAAAEQLRYREARATVVLVSDGRETCGVDACAVARELAGSGIDFTTHVIGFDVTAEERAELACLAEATDGLYLTADDTDSLLDALRAAMREVSRGGDALLWLSAALGPGRAAIEDAVHWRIRRLDGARGDAAALVVDEVAGSLTPRLGPGRYRVDVEYDGVQGGIEIDYDPSRRERRVVELDAGQVDLVALGADDAPLPGAVRWTARPIGGTEPVRTTGTSEARFTLPAGRYAIDATARGGTITEEITLRAGRRERVTARFGTGRLALRAVLAAGGPPVDEPVAWTIHDRAARVVAEVERPTTLQTLPTGRYRVTGRIGDTWATSDVEVRPSHTTNHTLDLGAGRARIFAAHAPPGGPILDPIDWRIERLDADGPEQAASGPLERRAAAADLVLPAGRYRVSGVVGAFGGTRDFEIRPGGRASIQVTFR